ncbi:Carboxy-terminal domain (CTD) phosphatase, partial [Ceratobasidium sp. 392]
MTIADLTTPEGVIAYLASTKYAATDVQALSGGYTGFTYRVVLRNPGAARAKSVVLKHIQGHAALDQSWVLSKKRMTFEYEALEAIASSPLSTPDSTVQVPQVLHYDPETYVLIMTDLTPARLLNHVLVEALEAGTIREVSERIGAALGDFMGRFHKWGSDKAQARLRARFLENTTSSKTVLGIWYRLMLETAENNGLRSDRMSQLAKDGLRDAAKGGSVIAMADFWFGNILVSTSSDLRIYIVDWELTRCARPELDVARLATAAYSLTRDYPSPDGSFILMQSFVHSYRAHQTLDEIQLALSAGRDVMMPWITQREDGVKEQIAQSGLNLLKAAKERDVARIRRNSVLRDLYSTTG